MRDATAAKLAAHGSLVGNRHFAHALAPGVLASGTDQVRVEVGSPDDPREHEARRIAARVAPQSSEGVTAVSPTRSAPFDGTLTRQDLTRGGAPLAPSTRAFFERRLGEDLANVRIHRGAEANSLTSALGAAAFTYANHVWLGAGARAEPNRLLAHELVHVLQQKNSGEGPLLQREQLDSATAPRPDALAEPSALIAQGRQAAYAGDHARASELFRAAYAELESLVIELTNQRANVLAGRTALGERLALEPERQAVAIAITRDPAYFGLQRAYGAMREILTFYFARAHEARRAGDTDRERLMSMRARDLARAVRARSPADRRGMIAEVTPVVTPRGPGLELHGTGGVSTELTELPGLPLPAEVVDRQQIEGMPTMAQTLYEQEAFLDELRREQAISSEFAHERIDMTRLDHRLRVWRTMYVVYRDGPTAPLGGLRQLMALMGRYLRAFTVHTRYNIRDWGDAYYDVSLPYDLLGRAEMDCGVYAMTVAYELFRTARSDRRMQLDFELVAMPEHVALIIRDREEGVFYLVNNDQVSPALQGNMYDVVRSSIPREYLITPGLHLPLGSTDQSLSTFRRQAWQRYLDSASWALYGSPADSGPVMSAFYQSQAEFDRGAAALDARLDRLQEALRSAAPAEERQVLETFLTEVSAQALSMARLFDRWARLRPSGPGEQTLFLERGRRGLSSRLAAWNRAGYGQIYVFTDPGFASAHPFVRLGAAVERQRSLGGVIPSPAVEFESWLRSVPVFATPRGTVPDVTDRL